MTFNAGNMNFCDWCDHIRCALPDDGHEVFYCSLGEKIDSSECELFAEHANALTVATAVGKAIDLTDGHHDDEADEKERLIGRMADALADYYESVWDSDLTYEIGCPGNAAMKARVTS
jgi:hypothetical protein